MKIKLINPLFVLAIFTMPCLAQTTIYVSPAGTGNAFSSDAPGSIDNLSNKLKELGAGNSDVTVYLRNGTYNLSRPLLINTNDKGRNSKLLISAAPGEKATLSGGVKVKGWTPYKNGIYKAHIPTGLDSRQLYVNGKLAIRARTPNRESIADFGPYYTVKAFDAANKTITVAVNVPSNITRDNVSNAEIVLNQHWYQSRLPFDFVQKTNNTVTVSPRGPISNLFFSLTTHSMLDPGKTCYFENSLEFLDDDNEWYIDSANQTVYYKPAAGQDITKLSIVLPVLRTILSVDGTSTDPLNNVQVENLNFEYTTWTDPNKKGLIITQAFRNTSNRNLPTGYGAIQASYINNLSIKNCNITALAANGIVFLKGVKKSDITHNHIFEIAGNGIIIDPYSYNKPIIDDAAKFTDDLISGNLIEYFGIDYTNAMGIVANYVSSLTIEKNEIRFGPYMGMQVGNQFGDVNSGVGNNIIRFNNIHHIMQLHDDGGAIYTLSNQPGTKIYNNWIHDISKSKWADNYPVNGIYLDNNSAFIQVQNNVLENLSNVTPLKQNSGIKTRSHDNSILQNNLSNDKIRAASGVQR